MQTSINLTPFRYSLYRRVEIRYEIDVKKYRNHLRFGENLHSSKKKNTFVLDAIENTTLRFPPRRTAHSYVSKETSMSLHRGNEHI